MSAKAGKVLETSQKPWDVALKQKAALSKAWKDKPGEGSIHTDSDKEKWKEGKGEQESLGNKRRDSALTRSETNPAEVLDNWVYLPRSKSEEDGNTCLSFCLSHRGMYLYTYQVS